MAGHRRRADEIAWRGCRADFQVGLTFKRSTFRLRLRIWLHFPHHRRNHTKIHRIYLFRPDSLNRAALQGLTWDMLEVFGGDCETAFGHLQLGFLTPVLGRIEPPLRSCPLFISCHAFSALHGHSHLGISRIAGRCLTNHLLGDYRFLFATSVICFLSLAPCRKNVNPSRKRNPFRRCR